MCGLPACDDPVTELVNASSAKTGGELAPSERSSIMRAIEARDEHEHDQDERAAQACAFSAGSGDSEYSKIMTGIEATEFEGSLLTVCPKIEHVKRSGAVSPATRATARVVPVTIPPIALREHDAEHGAPLRDAERVARLAQMIRDEREHLHRRPRDQRQHRRSRARNRPPRRSADGRSRGTSAFTSSVKTKIPITIDGKPFRMSSQSRTCERPPASRTRSRRSRPTADRKCDRGRDRDQHDRADDCGRDPAAALAEDGRPLREEVPVERAEGAGGRPSRPGSRAPRRRAAQRGVATISAVGSYGTCPRRPAAVARRRSALGAAPTISSRLMPVEAADDHCATTFVTKVIASRISAR